MDATPNIDQQLVDQLRRRLRIQAPDIETDPVYQYTDFDLWEIIQDCVSIFNVKYTITTLPPIYYGLVLTLGVKEVLWRLALSTAPYYRLEAEGAVLEKNMRFDHYYKLVVLAQQEYENSLSAIGGAGVVESFDVTASRKHNTVYNYERSEKPTVALTLSGVTSSSVNLDWTKFSVPNGKFYAYKLYIDTSPIVDEYALSGSEFPTTAKYVQLDVHKIKHRFTGLTPATAYYVCVVSVDTNGRYGYAEETFNTLPAS